MHYETRKQTACFIRALSVVIVSGMIGMIGMLGLAAGGCAMQDQPGDLVEHTTAVSQCGGFQEAPLQTFEDRNFKDKDYDAYCAREMLYWKYNSATEVLSLANTRVLLNCCGDHHVTVEKNGDIYTVTEIDDPPGGHSGYRCGCLCVFDYLTEIPNVAPKDIHLHLALEVNNDGESAVGLQYDGVLPLSTKSAGEIVIDPHPEDVWCNPSYGM
jgi:hypothetical protein